MKKYLIIGLSIISSLFLVSTVKAETKEFEYGIFDSENYVIGTGIFSYQTYFDNFKEYDNFSFNLIENKIKDLIKIWEDKYKNEFPNYFISIRSYPKVSFPTYSNMSTQYLRIMLIYSKYIPISVNQFGDCFKQASSDIGMIFVDSGSDFEFSSVSYDYSFSDLNIFDDYDLGNSVAKSVYLSTLYYDSNFDLSFGLEDTIYNVKKENDILFTLSNKTDVVPTYKDKFVDKTDLNYVEVDLNSYPYIILSLKDYSKTEEFTAINYVKGQYCLTSVYNYGSTEKKDIIEGSKTKRCSLYYDNYTPIRTYILNSDLKNNAIYYLKAYDTTKENKVKIDTSVFNIHYISEEEKDNPIITINGKKHTPKSYDELTDTATKSEDENYADGASEEFSITDIFTAPLEFFKKIINAISEFNGLIKELFSFLPDEFLAFILAAFALLVVVAIIKNLL
mgnify:FL=1